MDRLLIPIFIVLVSLLLPALASADRVVILPLGHGGDEMPTSVREAIMNTATSELNRAGHTVLPDTARAELSSELLGCREVRCGAAVAQAMNADVAVHFLVWNGAGGAPGEVVAAVVGTDGTSYSEGIDVENAEGRSGVEQATAEALRAALNLRTIGTGNYLDIRGGPVGARCIVNGEEAGQIPSRVEVEPGMHNIRIEMEGFEPFETTVRVSAGGEELVEVTLTRAGSGDVTESSPSMMPLLVGGAMVAAGVVLLISPIATLAADGDLSESGPGPNEGEYVSFGTQSTILLIGGSALVLGGAAVMLIPTLTADSNGASAGVSLQGTF